MSEDISSVMRRIRKMLNIAEDSRADPMEAAAAAAQAANLMRKYQLEHSDVIKVELQKGESLEFADVNPSLNPRRTLRKPTTWAGTLALAAARLHDCEVRYVHGNGLMLRFHGYKHDCEVAVYTFNYLMNCVRHAMKKYQGQWRGVSASDAYRKGFVLAINHTISKILMQRAEEREKQKAASTGTDITLFEQKQQAIAREFGEFEYNTNRTTKQEQREEFSEGWRDGRKVDVNRRGIEGQDQTKIA